MGSAQMKHVPLSSSSSSGAPAAATGPASASCSLDRVGTIAEGCSAVGVAMAGGAGMLFAPRPFCLDDDDDDSEVSNPFLRDMFGRRRVVDSDDGSDHGVVWTSG